MALKGDFRKLAAKVEQIRFLGSGEFTNQAAKLVGEASFELARDSIQSRTGPGGRPWASRAITISPSGHATGGGPALSNAGRGIALHLREDGFTIDIPARVRGDVDYMAANQSGARHAPRENGKKLSRDELRQAGAQRKSAVNEARRRLKSRSGTSPSSAELDTMTRTVLRERGHLRDIQATDRWKLPARSILPKRGVPGRWRKRLDALLQQAFRNALA